LPGSFDRRYRGGGFVRRKPEKDNKISFRERVNAGRIKKKTKEIREGVYSELESYFPDIFTNVISTAFWSKIKMRTLKILNGIINDVNTDKEIADTDKYFVSLIRPKKLTGKYTDEIRYEHGFEQNCIVLSKFINQPVKTLSTKEYFSLIQYYNIQSRKK
jgi:hypothetical protein